VSRVVSSFASLETGANFEGEVASSFGAVPFRVDEEDMEWEWWYI
jgi:hypothetical protein